MPPAVHGSFFGATRFEFRQAIRSLARRPAFAIVTVLTLTLGIGANTAVFSLANWLMFRPVPGITRPDELVTVRQELQNNGAMYTITVSDTKALGELPGLAALAGLNDIPLHVAIGGGAPARVQAQIVTSNFFDVLGQRLTLGRAFSRSEDDPGLASVAIVSDRYWRDALGRDSAVLGRQLVFNGHPFTVIGVAAKGFRGPDRAGRADIWVPLASFRSSMPSYPATLLTGRVGLFFSLLGRLAPGSSVEQINQQAEALRERLIATSATASKYKRSTFVARPGLDTPVWQREGLRQMFALLLTFVALLLVLTCANVANLLFAHAHERQPELATRQALGASRARVIRQLLLEGLLLAGAGGVLSLAAAALIGWWINGLVVAQNIPALSAVELDWRVFAFATALSLSACVAASLLPALFSSRVDVIASLKLSGRGQAPAGRRVRRLLTAVQVAVAVALLASGLLLVRSMLARYGVPLGFDAGGVLAFSAEPGLQGYSEDRMRQFYRTLLARLREQPGVASAGLAWVEPFRAIGGGSAVKQVGQPDTAAIPTDSNMMSSGFFPALGARFLAGRDFTDDETFRPDEKSGGGVLIINAMLARRLFGTTDAAGRQVETALYDTRVRTIVGVVDDLRTRNVDKPVEPTAYEPFGQSFMSGWGTIHVRLAAPATAVLPRIREVMRTLDPQMPIYDIELLSESVDRHLADHRLIARTIGLFALLATLVAALGLYGVLARGVAERRREFSIRAALGAGPLGIARLVTREAMTLTLVGAAVGLGAAAWLAKLIETRLFGVSAFDPVSLAGALAVVVVVAVASAAVPARRAAGLDVVSELK